MHHHTVQTLCKIFYQKHSNHILSNGPPEWTHMNGPPCYLIAIPFLNKVKEKLHENRIKKTCKNTKELNEIADQNCIERYCLQSPRDSKSNHIVCWKAESGQRKRRSIYENDSWLRLIRTLILFLYNFLILSVVFFNMKTFCVKSWSKKDKTRYKTKYIYQNWKQK